jgi:hypothetical protein
MEPLKKPQACPWWRRHPGFFLLLLLAALLAVLFARSFLPQYILFSNDGPLGALASQESLKWSNFHGVWWDLNSIGIQGITSNLSITQVIHLALRPVAWAKFFAPLTLLILGLAAGFCFRKLGLSHIACVLGALAVALNTGFFSAACWGVASQTICVACCFIALGFLVVGGDRLRWVRVVLAGMAVGMGVVEAYDIGALFSMCVAAFVLVQPWLTPGPPMRRVVSGLSRLMVVVCFALLIAFQAVSSLISTQIKGVAGTQQDTRTRTERWDYATQWSLPKMEALGFVFPGLFGYRMDSPGGGNYWGAVGQDPEWDHFFASGAKGTPPSGFIRFSGGGSYAGVFVVLVAAWAVVQSFRKEQSVFALAHRKAIWFWTTVGFVALLLAFGRFAPFYQFIYVLPYFSTIRNPAKFTFFVELSIVILFAYGVHGLSRRYLETPLLAKGGMVSYLRAWWGRVQGFDRRWTALCLLGVVLSGLGWLFYAASRAHLEAYLQKVQFDAAMAKAIAAFSIEQVGWFVLLLALGVGSLVLVVSGFFAGRRAGWAGVWLGALLVLDLGRANAPFIVYWDWPQKYASNEVLDFLRRKPYEQRVAILPFPFPQEFSLLDSLYRIEWVQHHFQYYKIQSLDVVQMPRVPEDLAAFQGAMARAGVPGLLRRWELTSTRYLVGPAGFTDELNRQMDPQLKRFSNALRFDVEPKPGIAARRLEELTAVVATNGPFAVIEFAGALPKAGLYSHWITQTNDAQALQTLVSPGFNPAQTVLVATNLTPAAGGATNQSPGTVAFSSYAPKDLVLKADVKTPAVLLLNDKYDPGWQVEVDGHPAPLLRCNFIMRGVSLTPGSHTVEFHFRPPYQGLYVHLATVTVGLLLLGYLGLSRREKAVPASTDAPSPAETARLSK